VSDADLVVPLQFRPVVARGVGDRKAWLDLGTKFFQSPEMWDVNVAASGPANWERVKVVSTLEPGAKPGRVRGQVRLGTDPTKVALPAAIVSGIATDDDELEFDVDQVGVPVLVKTSYFPGWHVEGADGPYRVAPNQMVVIPTSRHVRLHFDESGVEKLSYAMTLVGLVGLVGLHRAGPVVYPTPRRRRRSTDGRYLGDPGFGDGFAHARSGDDSGDDSGHDSGDGAWLFEWGDDRFQLQGLDSDEDPLSVAPLGDPLDPPRSPPVTSWDVGPPEQPAW
jgi:hypothetical protein